MATLQNKSIEDRINELNYNDGFRQYLKNFINYSAIHYDGLDLILTYTGVSLCCVKLAGKGNKKEYTIKF